MGPIEISGLEGATMIAAARLMAPTTPGAGAAAAAPSKWMPTT